MDDGVTPAQRWSTKDDGHTGAGVVSAQDKFCMMEYQCYQRCQKGDVGACLISKASLVNPKKNSTTHLNTVSVVLGT